MDLRFDINAEDSELIIQFARLKSLSKIAEAMGKDPSVISRKLKYLAEVHELLEKVGGKWQLTARGEALVEWAHDAIYSQKLALNQQKSMRIGSTREFASRILLPNLSSLIDTDDLTISFVTSDEGVENLILSGSVDFAFDCGRPRDPSISFRRVIDERFVTVASAQFIKKFKIKSFKDLSELDRLRFGRTENSILDLRVESAAFFGTFSDIATLREACCLGHGWAILPLYTVEKEVAKRQLKIITGQKIQNERYGVWWQRERASIMPWVEKAAVWLQKQSL